MSGAARPAVPAAPDAPMIWMYHAIAEPVHDPHQLSVPPDVFGAQMSWLARRGLRGVSVAELTDAVRSGSRRGLVGITFDDGYLSVLESALPVLRRHGFGATAFVVSGRLGGTNEWDDGPRWPLMTAAGVRELAAAGIEIGSHGATHARLAGLGAEGLAEEIAGSRECLSALTGTRIRGFAYPYGSVDGNAVRAASLAGYQYACAVRAPRAGASVMALPRIYIGRRDRAARLLAKRMLHQGHIVTKGRRR